MELYEIEAQWLPLDIAKQIKELIARRTAHVSDSAKKAVENQVCQLLGWPNPDTSRGPYR